jgi:hypothetical protein
MLAMGHSNPHFHTHFCSCSLLFFFRALLPLHWKYYCHQLLCSPPKNLTAHFLTYRSHLSGMSTCQDFVVLFFSLWKKTFWALSFVLLSPLDWPVWLEDTHLLTKKDGVRSGCYCCCWINLSRSDLFWIWLLLNVIKF